jgi:hypothetical protein
MPEKSLEIQHNVDADIVTIDGVRYSGVMFRGLAKQFGVGTIVQIVARKDGVVTMTRLKEIEVQA